MTPATQDDDQSDSKKQASAPDAGAAGEQSVEALKKTVQEQRRALTLLRAEADKERELRQALEAQLLEANAEIVASWDRRKEMSRLIGEARDEIKQHKERRREMAQVISGREAAMKQMKQELQARYEELAALQRHMMHYSPAGWAKLLARRFKKLGR